MKKVLVILTIIFILIVPKGAYADNKEYFVDKLNIDVQILTNGDLFVNEVIEYRFNGDFNGIYRNLELEGSDGYEINRVSIIDDAGNTIEAINNTSEENNTYEINEDYNETQIKIFCKSSNESKRFNINYTIKGAAKKYADFSQLYWKFYDVENVESVKEGTLKISLQDGVFDVNNLKYDIYGEGEITSSNTENCITINFKDLTTLIGIDMSFQKDYLSMVNEIKTDNYDKSYNFDDTNNYKEENGGEIGIIVLFLFIGVGGAIGAFTLEKNKFNKELNEYRTKYLFTNEEFVMEPPSDLPPALINLLINEKHVSKEMLITTLLYLANKGYYTIEEKIIKSKKNNKDNNKDLIFTRTEYYKKPEYSHLEYVLDWFSDYEVNGSFSMKQINKLISSESEAKKFIDNLDEWTYKVEDDGDNRGFYVQIRNKNVLENSWYSERNKWIAYKDYLINIYKTKDIDSNFFGELTIIYAAALGINEDSLKEIINVIINKASSNINSFNSMQYMYINNYFFYRTMFNNMNNDAYNIVNPPDSSTNFNSFSGSDFSGGGGGGSGAF